MTQTDTNLAEGLLRAHRALENEMERLQKQVTITTHEELTSLGASLEKVHTHLLNHFRFEEQDGYMTEVAQRAPQKDRTIQALLDEHQTMAQKLEELRKETGQAITYLDSLCSKIQDWIKQVNDHEQRENALVLDAFQVDIGNKD